ncbi:polyprenyl synthetase family protein [Sandaracinus amylolyticus]|uniref:Octaprenyl diphosphate synthase n=1 Tax=Sandaracinus amylolyticus TaxID=927083 RepID=A0A0F6SEV7_9BACT|nr:polyprenyl synthetase family protein [Sandaracinus amylolyticus]AKF05864.1 Octaprenyl diphosphate synthase [Sandaracinus amylolyticus]
MLDRPTDWPLPGPIDLDLHDLPHASSTTEWWYVNSHLEVAGGRRLALFASFFRILSGVDERTKERQHAHSLTWAIVDLDRGEYVADSLVDKQAPRIGLEKLERGEGTRDPRLRRAIREVLVKGEVPLPDRMFEGDVTVATRRLELDYDGQRFVKHDDGTYSLSLRHTDRAVGCDLRFRLDKPVVRHGDDGVVRGPGGEDMFYYFCPRATVTGTLVLDGQHVAVERAIGWYDHEFGGHREKDDEEDETPREVAWNWVSLQLEGGIELSAYDLFDLAREGEKRLEGRAKIIGRDGRVATHEAFTLEASGRFVSTRTFNEYPTAWRLRAPDARVDLELVAPVDDQEFITVLSEPAFWEGRVEVRGTIAGEAVRGVGFVERSGFSHIDTLDEFFSAVGTETRRSVHSVMPLEPSFAEMRELIASREREQYMRGVDVQLVADYLTKPIREIVDRGGKSWRSYAALACCDVVGGDSRKYVRWLAMPELMHTGSLIVDDVQDRSEVRRGGPTCHAVHGDAIAINSGTAAYFLGQKLLRDEAMSSARQVRIYDLYFEALRAGHGGQALDLAGLHQFVPAAVESGDSADLEERVLAIHRLKTAAPAAALARMGALAGQGTEAQIEAVGGFFEALGLAFQIVDDVLNLEGFRGDLKTRGEDVMHGKVTLPFAKAMSLLGREERVELFRIVASKPSDTKLVARAVEMMASSGAIAACKQQARDLVEDAWARFDPLVEASLVKVMLRGFGWYVLERHY